MWFFNCIIASRGPWCSALLVFGFDVIFEKFTFQLSFRELRQVHVRKKIHLRRTLHACTPGY